MYDFFAIYVHFLFIFGFLCGWKEKKTLYLQTKFNLFINLTNNNNDERHWKNAFCES